MRGLRFLFGLVVLFAATLQSAAATGIQYSTTSLGGSSWRYDYVVTNDSLASLDEFAIHFDPASFADLVHLASPAGWSTTVLQPGPGAGVFDSLGVDAGIANGASLGGFSVSFTFLGTGTPGSQPFDIIDPFVVPPTILQSGVTTLVPEPAAALMLPAGLLALWMARRRTGVIARA
jgi:hypothetical protein